MLTETCHSNLSAVLKKKIKNRNLLLGGVTYLSECWGDFLSSLHPNIMKMFRNSSLEFGKHLTQNRLIISGQCFGHSHFRMVLNWFFAIRTRQAVLMQFQPNCAFAFKAGSPGVPSEAIVQEECRSNGLEIDCVYNGCDKDGLHGLASEDTLLSR
jgi:hypothetical protein